MVKRISALAAVLLCVFMLCSCTASRSQIGAYVRGTLDSVYLNKNSDEYLESVGGTAEECETQYQQYIRDEVEYFKMCMDIDEVSDANYQRMVKIFETLYAHCKYEVGEVTRSSDRFLVSVTVYPIDNGWSFSARSLGKVNVQVLMENIGNKKDDGGGHLTMAGAQLYNIDKEEAVQKLYDAIDKYYNNLPQD